MKKYLLVLSIIFLIFSCSKDADETIGTGSPSEPYIKNLILPDTKPPYTGSFYIHVVFKDESPTEKKEITFSKEKSEHVSVV